MADRGIEDCMILASDGSPEAVRDFYALLLDAPMYVPERFQADKLRETVTYPDSFLNLFAVKAQEDITVPVFTQERFVREWADKELKCRTLKAQELFRLLPENWTVTINPGQEVEKEISWWEVERLKFGASGIDEVVAEILQDSPVRTLDIAPAAEAEFGSTISALAEAGAAQPLVSSVHLLKEIGRDADGRENISLLIGAVVRSNSGAELREAEDALRSAAQRAQIGGYQVKVFAGDSLDSVALGPFKHFEPIYRRAGKKGPLAKILGFFRAES